MSGMFDSRREGTLAIVGVQTQLEYRLVRTVVVDYAYQCPFRA